MNNRIKFLFLLTVCLQIAVCSSAMAQKYAVAVGSSALYQMKTVGGTITSTQIYNLGTTVSNRSAAVCNDKLVITETDGTSSSLRVFSLTGGNISEESSISLTNVKYARSISVDSDGGIYVGDGSNPNAYYSYVPSLSSTATSKKIGSDYAPLRDTAASGSTALIISERNDTYDYMSNVSSLQGGNVRSTVSLVNGTTCPCMPVAVAASGNYGYVISQDLVQDYTSSGDAALSVCTINHSTGTLTAGTTYALSDFDPTDVTTYTNGSTDYLALIGRGSGGSMLVKIADITSGLGALTWAKELTLASDGSVDYKFIGSEDGDILWYSKPSGAVGAIDTSLSPEDYDFIGQASLNGITGLVAFTNGMEPVIVPVPEPSSLAAIATFGLGAIGIFRRRKSA